MQCYRRPLGVVSADDQCHQRPHGAVREEAGTFRRPPVCNGQLAVPVTDAGEVRLSSTLFFPPIFFLLSSPSKTVIISCFVLILLVSHCCPLANAPHVYCFLGTSKRDCECPHRRTCITAVLVMSACCTDALARGLWEREVL